MRYRLSPSGIGALLLFTACIALDCPPAPHAKAVNVVESEPAPPVVIPDDKPEPDHAPARIIGDAKLKAGTFGYFNLAIEPPEGGTVVFKWTCPGADFGRAGAGNGPEVTLTAPVGAYVLHCDATLQDGKWKLTLPFDFPFQYGEPEPPKPPKPLSELAGKDAGALAAAYQTLADMADSFGVVKVFNEFAAHKLGPLATNPAAVVVAGRLDNALGEPDDAIDAAALRGVLDGAVKELGVAPTVPPEPTRATAATYVYEKHDTSPPSAVMVGLNRLNRERKIMATIFDEDTVDGDDQVPDQYVAALAAATQAGLPAFVVVAGDKVLTVVKAPTTEAQIMEAVK